MHQRDICTPVSTAAPFTTAKTRRQPERPAVGERIFKMCIHIMDYHSALKQNETGKSISCDSMDETRGYHCIGKELGTERQIPYGHTYIWNLKMLNS